MFLGSFFIGGKDICRIKNLQTVNNAFLNPTIFSLLHSPDKKFYICFSRHGFKKNVKCMK